VTVDETHVVLMW